MRWLAIFVGMLLAGWAAPALASGDTSCTPRWQLGLKEASGCDSRLALSPANDTRVNLFLLMRDHRRAPVQPLRPAALLPPHFAYGDLARAWQPTEPARAEFLTGEGSRCRSNDDGKSGFTAAVRAARGLAEADRAALIAAREAYDPSCDTSKPLTIPTVGTTAKPFADYLRAAGAFYDGEYEAAGQGFATLTGVGDAWLAETASYMTARIELNRAQESAFDDWGELDRAKVDRAALARAQANFYRYLAAFPAGRYAASARGLLRRVWWFGGDKTRLAAAYGALMRQDPAKRGIDDFALAQEIDYKLGAIVPGTVSDPLLLAMLDLAAMRKPAGAEGALTAAELERQRPAFAREPALYGYLQAAFALHVANRPADVLRLIPDATGERANGVVTLSRQLLRGQALEAVRDPNARGFWLQLLPAVPAPMSGALVELGLAMHDERAGRLDALLAPGSPLTTPVLRETLLFTVADAATLRRAARSPALPRHERDVALFQLLYKQLSRGGYAGFVQDLALVPAGASAEPVDGEGLIDSAEPPLGLFTQTRNLGDLGCPPLRVTATTLAANPADPRARLCVADFFQANNFDGGGFDAQPPADQLGGTRSLFAGKPYERAAVYRTLLASAATPAQDKAYALYRALRCYAPTGSNSCGGEAVPTSQRAAWFRQLKRDYPRSRWAQRLSFYW